MMLLLHTLFGVQKKQEDLVEQGAAFMSIVSSSPDLLKGVNPERIANFQKAAGTALAKYRQACTI